MAEKSLAFKSNLKKPADLSVNLAGLKLKNPIILASGILGLNQAILKRVIQAGAGAVITKSITQQPKSGHNNPILVKVEHGFLNAVGYANPGLQAAKKELQTWEAKAPLILSLVAPNAPSFARLTKQVETIPHQALEIVLSCPHTPSLGILAGHSTPQATFAITQAVRRNTQKPLSVKLSPSSSAVGEIAQAAEAAGADIINMGNTLGPGMAIDITRHQPILDFKVGGLSGPAIKPITLRCVYDIYQAVKIPIIATGGITTGQDAIEMFLAGATAVSLGSAIYYRGLNVFKKVCQEITAIMKHQRLKTIKAVTGLAHQAT